MTEEEVATTVPTDKKQHTSRCLACKKNFTYEVEYEGTVVTL